MSTSIRPRTQYCHPLREAFGGLPRVRRIVTEANRSPHMLQPRPVTSFRGNAFYHMKTGPKYVVEVSGHNL